MRALERAWRNDYLVTLISNFLLSVGGLLTGILTARLLGPEGRGSLAAILVWTNVIGALGVIGIPHALTYYAGRYAGQRNLLWRISLLLASVQGLLLSVGCAVALPIILRTHTSATRQAAVWFSFFILLSLFQGYQLALLQGAGHFRLWNLLRLLSSAWYLMLLVLLAIGGLTLVRALLAQMVALAITSLVTSYLCHQSWGGAVPKVEHSLLRPLFSFGAPTAVAGLSHLISTQLDQLLLTQFVSPAELGVYVVAVGLTWSILPVSQAMSSVAYSHMAQASERKGQTHTTRLSLALTFWLLLAAGIVGALWAKPLIHLFFGEAYGGAVMPFRVLALAVPFLGGTQIMTNLVRGTGRPLLAGLCEAAGAVLTAGLLYMLLPSYGITGAAIASLAAYATVFFMLLVALSRTLMQPVSLLLRPLPLGKVKE